MGAADKPVEAPKPSDAPPPGADPLNAARMPAPGDVPPPAADTGSQHLPAVSFKADDMQYAQQHFNPAELKVLTDVGPEQFNKTIDYIRAEPGAAHHRLDGIKGLVDGVNYLHEHPEVPFNPYNVPGTYAPESMKTAQTAGLSVDEMHTLQVWGPNNFNKMMQDLKDHPDKAGFYKDMGDKVQDWLRHPDMPKDAPAVDQVGYDPKAVQFAQTHGFAQGQINLMAQFGAGNFNRVMDHLAHNPGEIVAYQNIINKVGEQEVNLAVDQANRQRQKR